MTTLAHNALQLTYKRGADTPVVVTPEDENRFILRLHEAVEACRAYLERERFEAQFRLLLEKLAQWLREHESFVHQAFLTERDRGLLFLVVQRSPQYDKDLEEALTQLDLQIARDAELDLIPLSVLAVPDAGNEVLSTFLSPRLRIQFVRGE